VVEGEVAVDESHRLPETLLYFLFHGFKNLGPGSSIIFCDVYMPKPLPFESKRMVVIVVGGEPVSEKMYDLPSNGIVWPKERR
jgi:hypothetical protein